MSKWVRFRADKQHDGWTIGPIVWIHKHRKDMSHVLFVLNLGWWYVEVEIGYEPQD